MQKPFATLWSAGCVLFLFLALNVNATIIWWDPNGTSSVGGNGTWDNTTSNWANTGTTVGAQTNTSALIPWSSADAAGFCAGPSSSASQGTFTITLNSAITCAGIFNGRFTPGPCTVTLNGTGSLNLGAGLPSFDSIGGFTYIDVPITGTGLLTLEDSGQFFLNASNTYSAGTALGYSGNLFDGVVNYNNSNSFGTGAILVSNLSTLNCGVVEEGNGVVVTNAWKVNWGVGGLNFVGDAGPGATFSGPWTLTSNLNVGSGVSGTYVILSGVMSGAGALNKFNPGTLRLSGANTYTGNTSISNGVLQLGVAGGIPSGSGKGSLTVTNGGGAATLDVNGFSGSVNGLSGNGTIDNTSSNAGALSIGNNNVSSTFIGVVQNSGTGPLSITKAGTGAFTFAPSSSSYNGNTTISTGTLALGANNAISSTSPVTVAAGATLNMAGFGSTMGGLTGGGSVTNNSGGITLDGNISPSNFPSYSCFFGTIDQGSLAKGGSHVMSLRQTNMYNINFTYTGGVLSVGAGPNRLPASFALTVPSGGLFQLDANSQTVSSLNSADTTGAVNLGGGTLSVLATSASLYNGTIQNSELPGSSTAAGHGLRGYYYNGIDFSTLDTVRDDPNINFNFTNSMLGSLPTPPYPKTNYISVRWAGQVLTTVAGTYAFTTTSDDGQRLWVNGTNLVDDWASQSATAKTNTISLAANTRYDIVYEYMNITGGSSAKLAWTPPGDTVSTVIPTDFLFLPGPGNLVVGGSSQLTLSTTGGTTNTYTGGTTVVSGGTLEASGDNTLGQGNVYVNNHGSLTLDSGTTMSYISSNGDLVINGTSALLNLNYSGTDTIHGFSTNGGATYLPTGTYGSLSSGATYQIGQIVGGGLLNVTASPSTNILTSSGGTTVYGSSITFTSTVTGSGPTPTGTVTFYDGASAIGMATLSGGVATFTISDFQVATSPHSVTAVYNGDSLHIAATSSALTQIVSPLALTAGNFAASNKVYDSTINASIIISNLTLSGVLTNDTNNVHIVSGTATFSDKNIGTNKTVTITNLVLGGGLAGNYTVSPNGGTTTANISVIGTAVSNVTANSRAYNGTTNVVLNTGSATLANASVFPGDNVVLNSGGASASVATATVGNAKAVTVTGFTISGTDATNYSLSQPAGLTINIIQASTTNVLVSSGNPSATGANVTFTATPTPIAPGAGVPTGSVTFLTNGIQLGIVTLTNGSTSISTSNLMNGTNTILAEYAGDGNFIGSTNTLLQVVGGSPAPGPLSISRTGGSVILNWSGSFTLQSAPLVNGTNSGFADLPGPVLTGPYTNTNSATKMFFRLRN